MNATSEFTASNVAAFGDTDNLLEHREVFEVTLLALTARSSRLWWMWLAGNLQP